ncbi:1-phosphofructokinase [Pseudalkalibacillus berkeleyi]|uniref:Tagatose-6-phosphate kinase n=1 Tax=Pseudalkalibacillus berkeleyi TaxID=1069813 RepID=A0ABS9GV47_9BACL|nr:1-phosphofructokinase [Pseudalkalibacillus berkeleyi]MCF6136707.1 1-phosphofructokinase [Pseudalkalibacillus berkeleyi]
MIYTVTINPSLDYIVSLDELDLGKVNRSEESHSFPGGKGINVSRVLKRLGHSSRSLGFVGGYTGDFIKNALENEEIETEFIELKGDTRINVKVRSSEETEINGPSPLITSDDLNDLKTVLNSVSEEDIVVFAGSLPQSLEPSLYRDLIEQLPAQTKVIVDTKGVPLSQAIMAKPFLIKPNHHELGELFNIEIKTVEEAAKYAGKLIDAGAKNVLVSMAGQGALFVNNTGSYACTVPEGNVVNSVGAGDSVVAGFIYKYIKTGNVLESFQYGVAAGSASAFSIDFCTKDQVEQLLQSINIREVH